MGWGAVRERANKMATFVRVVRKFLGDIQHVKVRRWEIEKGWECLVSRVSCVVNVVKIEGGWR